MKEICFVCLLLIITASSDVTAQRRRTSKPKPTKPTAARPKDEAADLVSKSWGQYFLTCGDSHYFKLNSGALCEHKPLNIDYEDLPLSEADKLNGIERRVVTHANTKAERCFKDGAWPEWYPFGPGFALALIKRSGNWSGPLDYGMFSIRLMEPINLSCSDIPH
jgi:hypothetical protein